MITKMVKEAVNFRHKPLRLAVKMPPALFFVLIFDMPAAFVYDVFVQQRKAKLL
jgi:hypothetical protein